MADVDERSDARRTLIARLALVTSVALFAALSVWLLIAGPPEVIGHFSANNGGPRYDPTAQFVAIMAGLVAFLVVLFASTGWLMRRVPIGLMNIPNRERWNTPARREILARRVGADMNLMGAASVLLIVAMMVLSALGGLGVTPPGWAFVVTMGVFLVVIAAIAFGMLGKRYDPSTLPPD
ncbi:hypothetical protein EV141_2049 [Microcella putealis]|uniref:DUF1648 domain-containing protein n=1 Tax=Microcella putealis TaxID=337005 RepID=A0A4Q7LKA5_9MICO|nr:hypothetical protein [Microcella putealis]RZS55066.1 hypothetical protein EV141_2049 [Microcella putealis]TQM19602.1 hypothetical protein BJ957_2427 [Microcella putealis]